MLLSNYQKGHNGIAIHNTLFKEKSLDWGFTGKKIDDKKEMHYDYIEILPSRKQP